MARLGDGANKIFPQDKGKVKVKAMRVIVKNFSYSF